jgi:hypothetical protein
MNSQFKKCKNFDECSFCSDDRGIVDRIYEKDYTVDMLGDEIQISFKDNKVIEKLGTIYIPVNYCPMCGRDRH